MNAFQAQLPPLVDFPQHLSDNTYQWQLSDLRAPVADVSTIVYKVQETNPATPAVEIEKLMEKIILQNLTTFPLKVLINNAAEPNKFHFIIAGATAVDDGTGGTYIFFPRLEGIKSISVISVGGVGRVALTKIGCVKDL